MLYFFCHYTSSKFPPLKPVISPRTFLIIRSSSLDPTLAVANMITKIRLYKSQPESHPHMTITIIVGTTYPFLKLRISTKTRLMRIYVHFVSLSIIQYPIQSSFTQLNPKKGTTIAIQLRARSHRDTSPTQRVSQCPLLLYF